MSLLFERSGINHLTLENRFVRSATWEGMAAEDGAVTPRLIELVAALARGGVGLIVSGHAYVARKGQAGPWQLGVHRDDLIPGLSEMAAAVHDNNGKIVLQLAHAGYHAGSKLSGKLPVSPSAVGGIGTSPREVLTVEGIRTVVAAFAAAAMRAQSAGFDGVQIHAAHGYLLSQFLSPLYNRRTDAYGGSLPNRARLILEVLRGIRQAVGRDYPVLIKINCRDFHENGLTLADSLKAAEMLADAGIDAIELSGGLSINEKLKPSRMGIHAPDKEAYFKEEAAVFKKKLGVPLILVGGNRSFQVAEQIVADGVADFIAMSRPLIREPGLVNRWKSGDRSRSACLSDNRCFGPAMSGKGIYCVMLERES